MKNIKFVTTIAEKASRASFSLKKHSPEILIVAGIVGTVASAVLACRATLKVEEVLEDAKEKKIKVVGVKAAADNGELDSDETYTDKDYSKDLTVIYIQTGVKIALNYMPAILLGSLSIAGIVASNNILRSRNVALAAAYATIDKGFREYRARVSEKFGEETENELRYGIKAKKFETTVTDENGKTKKVKSTVKVMDPNVDSGYSRYFDSKCSGWDQNPDYRQMTLASNERYANDLLRSRGHLYLNEVYDMFDMPRSKAGQIVGWVYDEKNPVGDNYVEFSAKEMNRETETGYEPVVLLDFNVDGPILQDFKR